jgi:hypothetical protein
VPHRKDGAPDVLGLRYYEEGDADFTVGSYLDNALRETPTSHIDQEMAHIAGTHFEEPDTNDGRRTVPELPFEFRNISSGETDDSALRGSYDELEQKAQELDDYSDRVLALAPADSTKPYLELQFGQRVHTLEGDPEGSLQNFAKYVVQTAGRRFAAGERGRLAVNIEGGGSGGLRSTGARDVGIQRAQSVRGVLEPMILEQMQMRGLDHAVAVDLSMTSRGDGPSRSAQPQADGSAREKRRRVRMWIA